jgi:hypothetical protein
MDMVTVEAVDQDHIGDTDPIEHVVHLIYC